MSKLFVVRNNFVSGELSPLLLARNDLDQYAQGLRTCENFIVLPHGGVTRRPGTKYVDEVKDSLHRVRLIPFQYSTQEAYVIELGALYMRFYAKSGLLVDGSSNPVEVVTPWGADELDEVQYAQTADVMYLVHPNYLPRKLTRTTVTSFTLSTVAFSKGRAPFGALNLNSDNYPTTIAGTWPTLTITMTQNTFVAGDVGRVFYVRNTVAKNAYYAEIAGYTSPTVVTATGKFRFNESGTNPQGSNGDRWAMSIMSATRGCAAVTFHEGRLGYGGFADAPSMIWLSASDDFDNFEFESPDPSTADAANASRAIQRQTLTSGSQVNTVRWMAGSGEKFVVGCSAGEFVVTPDQDGILTPTSASIRRQTSRGSASLPPAVIDNTIFFAQRGGRRIREFSYDALQTVFKSKDVSILADHILRDGDGVRELVYQQDPFSLLWVVMQTGDLVAWTIERDQGVIGAHRHDLSGGGEAWIESAAVIPGEYVVEVATPQTGANASIISNFTNPGAESGSLTGWTTAGTWTAETAVGALVPQAGTYFFKCGSSTEATMRQDLDLLGVTSINTTMIDRGQTTIDWTQYVARTGDGGYVNATIEAFDANSASLGFVFNLITDNPQEGGTWRSTNVDTWQAFNSGDRSLPPLSRTLRFTLIANPTGATPTSGSTAAFDGMAVSLAQVEPPSGAVFAGSEDQLWLAIRRKVSGEFRRYVEIMSPSFRPSAAELDLVNTRQEILDRQCFLDSHLTYDVPLRVLFISSATQAVVTTEATHGIGTGTRVRLRRIEGGLYAIVGGRTFMAEVITPTSFKLKDLVTGAYVNTTTALWVVGSKAELHAEVTSVSGVDHLNGLSVELVADGSPQPAQTVVAGVVTLASPASIVCIGLPYTSQMTPYPVVATSRSGGDLPRPKRVATTFLRVMDTLGGSIGKGPNPTRFDPLVYRTGSSPVGLAPDLFTGDKKLALEGTWSESLASVTIRQDQPLPMTILGVYSEVEGSYD